MKTTQECWQALIAPIKWVTKDELEKLYPSKENEDHTNKQEIQQLLDNAPEGEGE